MNISVGILAYNEELRINSIIEDVLNQEIFSNSQKNVQFIVIPNGCTDRTSSNAKDTFCRLNLYPENNIIREINTAGKSNAWNEFVHRFSWQDADYLILVDADIIIDDSYTFTKLIQTLEDNAKVNVSTSWPRKNIELKKNKGLLDFVSLGLSKVDDGKSTAISGQLYCIRGNIAREIYLPRGLPVEDGFIAAMIHTQNFTITQPVRFEKVKRADSAYHFFQALTLPTQLYRHEKRLLIGTVINSIIFNELWNKKFDDPHLTGQYIRHMNEVKPNWLSNLIDDYKKNKGFFIVSNKIIFKHYIQWSKSDRSLINKLIRFPIVTFAVLLRIILAFDVNLFFHKKDGVGFW